MAYKLREGPCLECGRVTARRLAPGRRLVCIDCTTASAARAAREMRDKRGPAWDRWREVMADYARSELIPQG